MTPTPNDEMSRLQERERAAAGQMWQHMLDTIPTMMGRFVTVASFRVPETGEYHHPNLDRVFPDGLAGQILRESHERLFAEWLGLFPEEQEAELNKYLESLPQGAGKQLLLEAREGLLAPSANAAVRNVFLMEFAQILNRPAPLGGNEPGDTDDEVGSFTPTRAEAAIAG